MHRQVAAYARVSTEEQGRSGVSLEAQETAIRGEAERRGWQLVRVERDVLSGKTMNGRQGLARAGKDQLGGRGRRHGQLTIDVGEGVIA